ncbi:predicted protein [Nematostella vectensis]|uniref:Uncharacterized protein n=1 Tax=Nematostella vectensis TaxID=45351 RepID=A7RSA3_NEMVE|nr:uncharacterized protein LOC5517779 [Nematostella vectensis]EDO45774.1 predicted protein [Nematostella vectensis]|eukprot:XP_001637837.1 predicted protein [Nematostella vectensis]
MATRRPNTEFESDWAFIEEETASSIETKRDCVVYRKPTYSEILCGIQPNELEEGEESEPEFEILTGFKFCQEPSKPPLAEQDHQPVVNDLLSEYGHAAASCDDIDDGIMIISKHCDDPDIIPETSPLMSSSRCLLDDSFVSLSGWNELVCNNDAAPIDDYDWDSFSDQGLTDNDESGLSALPFYSEELFPYPSVESLALSVDLAGWNELTTLHDHHLTAPSTVDNPGKEIYDDHESLPSSIEAFGWDELPFYNSNLSDDGEILYEGQAVPPNPGVVDEIFQMPFIVNGQAEYLSMTASGSFRTIPCSDESSTEGSLIELICPDDNTDESYDILDSQIVDYDDDDDAMSGWKELPFINSSFYVSEDDSFSSHDIECIETPTEISNSPLNLPNSLSSVSSSLFSKASSFCSDSDDSDEEDSYDDDDDPYSSDESDSDESVLFPRWLEEGRPSDDSPSGDDLMSHLYVDIPTFVILLCLTTAMGFSIGHGVSVYLSNQAVSKTTKLSKPNTVTYSSPDSVKLNGLTAEQQARLDLWALEEKLYQERDDAGKDHFDIQSLHSKLQEKHFKLLQQHRTVQQRLQLSKSMSWYWRLKYDEEKRHQAQSHKFGTSSKNIRSFRDIYSGDLSRTDDVTQRRGKLNKDYVDSSHNVFKKYHSVSSLIPPRRVGLNNFRARWNLGNPNPYCSSDAKAPDVIRKRQPCRDNDKDVADNLIVNSRKRKKNIKKTNNNKNTRSSSSSPCHAAPLRSSLKPCFKEPKSLIRTETRLAKHNNDSLVNIKQQSKDKHAGIRRELLKKRELRRKQRELKMHADELKLIIAELLKERRLAEKEKHELRKSWRTLKRQQNRFESEKLRLEEDLSVRSLHVLEYLRREKKKMKNWRRTQKIQMRDDLFKLQEKLKSENVQAARQGYREILGTKRDLKLEKRLLREQKKDLKKLKKSLRKERRKFAKTQARKNKVVEKLSKRLNRVKIKNKFRKKTKQSARKSRKIRLKWKEEQERFWQDIENKLDDWVANKTELKSAAAHSLNNRRKRKMKSVKKWREALKREVIMEWNAMKRKYENKKVKTKRLRKKGPWTGEILDKILAEQRVYDQQKRLRKKGEKANRWDSFTRLQRNEKRSDFKNWRKKKHWKKYSSDVDALMRKRRRKQDKKYQRELERLNQWALQMNEKKLEHERLYSEKQKRNPKCPRHKNNDSKSKRKRTELIRIKNETVIIELKPPPPKHRDELHPDTTKRGRARAEKTPVSMSSSPVGELTSHTDQSQAQRPNPTPTDIKPNVHQEFPIPPELKPPLPQRFPTPTDIKPNVHQEFTIPPELKPPLPQEFPTPTDIKPNVHQEFPIPPELKPDMHVDFPLLQLIGGKDWVLEPRHKTPDIKSYEEPAKMRPRPLPPPDWLEADEYEKVMDWYVRRAIERNELRKSNPLATWFPPHDFSVKSDSSWLFQRSRDRHEQRSHPVFQHHSRGPRKRRRVMKHKDGAWFFERAHDRADQREPWYMRRAEGRQSERDSKLENWWLERGYNRDDLRGCHGNDDDSDEDSWFPWRARLRRRFWYPCF